MPTLPTQNPFENLFSDNQAKKNTTVKKGIPAKNPFEGIFDTQANKTIETPAAKQSQPVEWSLPARETVAEKVVNYISPQPDKVRAIDVVRELIPSLSQIFGKAVSTATKAVGAVVGAGVGAVGEKVKQDVEVLSGKRKLFSTDYKQIEKSAVKTATETAAFGEEIGKSGAEMAPIAVTAPVALDAFMVYSVGKNVYDAMEETGLKGGTKLEMTDTALKSLGAKGWESFGMPASMAEKYAENPLFSASGLAINTLMAYGASRGVSNNFFNGLLASGGILKGKSLEISSGEMSDFLKTKGVNTPDLPNGTFRVTKIGATAKGTLLQDVKNLGKTKVKVEFKPADQITGASENVVAKTGLEITTKGAGPTELAIMELKSLQAKQPNALSQSAGAMLVEKVNELQGNLSKYFDDNSKNVLTIKSDNTLINVNVVKIDDNKWGYGYDLMVGDNDVSAEFTNNQIFSSREAAVEAAKNDVITWAAGNVPDAVGNDLSNFQSVIRETKKVNSKLDVPVEVNLEKKPEIYHGAQVELKQIKDQGFIPGKHSKFGEAAFFSTSKDTAELHGEGKVLKVDPSKFNLLTLKDQASEEALIEETGKKTISEAVAAKGYDGFILQHPDKKVGNTYGIVNMKKLNETIRGEEPTATQKEKVKQVLRGEAKTIKEVAEETKILEPNVRRILGQGAKDGTFERIDKGVYVLKKDGKQLAYVETGDAVEVLPRLADEGLKADMVFLDIPYKTPAVTGGNRGVKYDVISPEQFKKVVDAIIKIARTEDTPIFHMFSQAKSGLSAMEKYNKVLLDAGLKPIARGEYTKLQKDGITRVRNMRGDIIEPEGLILLSKSGKVDFKNPNLNFKLIRPKGYQTEKPAEMIKALIEMSTKEGEVVLDPFAGSGVVPAEAVKAGREAVAVEKSEKAVEEFIKPRIEGAATIKKEKTPVIARPKAKIKIGKKEINTYEVAAKIIPKRVNLPVLSEMQVKDGQITSTNLNTTVTLKSGLPDGIYKLVGKDAIKTETDPGEFPRKPEVSGPVSAKILSGELSRILKNANKFVSGDSVRPELNGVYFKIQDGKIIIAATDAYRLLTENVRGKVSGNAEFILSEPDKIQKVIEALGGAVEITQDKNFIKLTGENGEIINIGIDGKYPDFASIIPSYKNRLSMEKSRLLSAIKDLKPHANSANKTIAIELGDRKIILKAVGSNGKVAKELEVLIHGSKEVDTIPKEINNGAILMPIRDDELPGKFAYNADYLIDALNSLEDDAVYLYQTDEPAITPGFFSNLSELKSAEKQGRAPSGLASTGGSKLGEFEQAGAADLTPEEFKIFEEVKKLVAKYAKTIGQGYQPSNSLGVFYPGTQNIRIRGLNHLSVAAHEITHFLDNAYKISDQLMGIKGYSIKGNPIYERDTAKLRKELTDIYTKFYPRAKETHALRRRMLEGFATLLEKYVAQPSTMRALFPNAVKEFLTSEGKYYKPVMGEILTDLRDIIANYQGLSPLDKIGARIVNDEVNINKDSFLNFNDKFKTEIADNVYPIEKLAKQAGVHFSKADPSLWVRQFNNSNALIANNLNGSRGYWGWRNGEVVKLHDYNWKTLINDISKEKSTDEFASFLVARREYFSYKELDKLEKDSDEYNDLKRILDNDGFTRDEVEEAYLQNKERFSKFAEKYDTLVEADLDFLHDPAVMLVDRATYNNLISQQGYASFKRAFYDEVIGEEQPTVARVRFGRTKISSMIQRKGSQRPIINPLYSAMVNHGEITRKGLKQIVYNRIGALAGQFPRLFQKQQLTVVPQKNGAMLFPQEKDPKIIMARQAYKRMPILSDAVIKRTIDEVLNPQNISYFEKLLMASSRFFTKGTTGLFPGFALTNTTVDQVTAIAQTRNKYKPIYDPLHALVKAIRTDNAEHTYLQEYLIMGGERQTFVGWQDMAPNELFNALSKERKGLLKAIDFINAGMNILAMPAQWSEIMTRATEYIKSRQAGKSPIVSLEEAGRVTAPFHHIGRFGGGRFGQVYVKSIPFFNPGIQVLAQAAETLNTKDGKLRYIFTTLAIVAASIAATSAIYQYGSEEQKQLYADINPDELNKYIWLPSTDQKTLIKIRVPDQMEVFATLFNMAVADKKLKADYTIGEYINAAFSWLPQQFDISNPARALLSWIPQIIKPGVLTLAGVKDFPKIMPLESQMQQSKPAGLRATESTSPVAKKLGEMFNISPIKIDYLLTGYAGRATGFLTGKPGVYNPFASMSRQYYFSSGRKLQEFYDMKKENDENYYAYKNKLRTFNLGERTKILQERAKLKSINDLVGLYRDIDTDKYPERADKLRNQILKKLEDL